MEIKKQREIEPVFGKYKLTDDQDVEYLLYWLSRPMEERVSHVEELREEYHGHDYALTQGLPRSGGRIERRRR